MFGFTFVTKCVELGKDLVYFPGFFSWLYIFDIGDVYSKVPLKSVKRSVRLTRGGYENLPYGQSYKQIQSFAQRNLDTLKYVYLLLTLIFSIFRKHSVWYYKVI